jgi:hypothetical protein
MVGSVKGYSDTNPVGNVPFYVCKAATVPQAMQKYEALLVERDKTDALAEELLNPDRYLSINLLVIPE